MTRHAKGQAVTDIEADLGVVGKGQDVVRVKIATPRAAGSARIGISPKDGGPPHSQVVRGPTPRVLQGCAALPSRMTRPRPAFGGTRLRAILDPVTSANPKGLRAGSADASPRPTPPAILAAKPRGLGSVGVGLEWRCAHLANKGNAAPTTRHSFHGVSIIAPPAITEGAAPSPQPEPA